MPLNPIITERAAWTPPDNYLRRETQLEDVVKLILDHTANKIQIRGIGGIGKTTFCCDLFWHYHQILVGEKIAPAEIRYLGWISYNRDLKNSVYGQLDSAGISAKDPDAYWQQAKALFHDRGSGLLLFIDNADHITEEDREYLCKNCHCRVIVTAREKIKGLNDFELPPLDDAECVKLYWVFSGDNDPEDESVIQEIVKTAGFHTQTVELLAKTQAASCLSAGELLAKLKKHGFSLADVTEPVSGTGAGKDSEKRLIEHLAAVFDIARFTASDKSILWKLFHWSEWRCGKKLLRVLKLFSLLATNTPVESEQVKEWLVLEDLKEVNELVRLGWLNKNGTSFSIHPVIAGTVQYKCKPAYALAEPLVKKLKDALKATSGEGVAVQNALLPHCVSVDKALHGTLTNSYAAFLDRIAVILREAGDYDRALLYGERAVAVAEKVNSMEHPDTAKIYNNIAVVYDEKGDYDKALEYALKDLAITEKVRGPEHPDTAKTYGNIGVVYQDKGDYDKALEYALKDLAITEKVLGTEHPDTAATYDNIGLVYGEMGDYDKALEYHKKALAIEEKVLGTEHPDTAATYNNIAVLYQHMGDYDKALEYYNKALAVKEKVLGTAHPDTATTYNNIAIIYQDKGDYDKALEYHEKAMAIREKVLGTEHPATAATYNNIGVLYQDKGDCDKALKYCNNALAIREKVLGTAHPYTAQSYRNLARIYEKTGDTEKAQAYKRKAGMIP